MVKTEYEMQLRFIVNYENNHSALRMHYHCILCICSTQCMVMIEKSECVMRTHPMVRNDIRSWNCNGTRFFSCATTSNNNKRPSIVDVKEKGATINSSSSQLLKMYVIVIASVQFTRTMPIKVKLRAKSDTIWHMFWIDKFFSISQKNLLQHYFVVGCFCYKYMVVRSR